MAEILGSGLNSPTDILPKIAVLDQFFNLILQVVTLLGVMVMILVKLIIFGFVTGG